MKHKILCLFLTLGFSVQAQAATLSFVLSDSNVELGESVRVDLVIDGLGDDILTGFDVSIFFDENIVSFESFDFGTGLDVLGLGSLQDVTSLGPGEVEVVELSFDLDEDTKLLQPENFILGTFNFTGLRSGTSALDILVWELAGEYVFETNLRFEVATSLNADVQSGSVEVQPPLDTDGDGFPDDQDNCPVTPNPNQTDNDSDGAGDVCDDDDDNDGVLDEFDAFPLDPTEASDSDGDGFGDNSDPFPLDPSIFFDVQPNYWAFAFVEALARAGITAGCGNDNYCPEESVTRAQMAVFLERGMKGSGYVPPPASGIIFSDVAAGDFAANFIEQLYADGITAGCGNNNYCPNAEVTRAQMAVFLLRAKYGPGYSPPAATGVFNDVDLGYWAVHWIEQLAAEGITAGCGNGDYCPDAPVTRAQVAVFLVRTFGL